MSLGDCKHSRKHGPDYWCEKREKKKPCLLDEGILCHEEEKRVIDIGQCFDDCVFYNKFCGGCSFSGICIRRVKDYYRKKK